MPPWIGYFDKTGSPGLKIGIAGVMGPPQEFEAVIDTGYSGFASVPLLKAFPLGLVLEGTTTVVLADGSTAYKLTALGEVDVGGDARSGVILLEPSSTEVLIGMQFLTTFNRSLLVDVAGQRVELHEATPTPP
jgi:predicted aspartyl protease